MYVIYTIESDTNNLEFLQVYDQRQEAIEHFKKDVEFHFNQTQGNEVRWIEEKEAIQAAEKEEGKGEGKGSEVKQNSYLVSSKEFANRIIGYRCKKVTVPGLFWGSTSTTVVNKVRLYSVIELPGERLSNKKPSPLVTELIRGRSNMRSSKVVQNASGKIQPKDRDSSDDVLRELRACLKTRRARVKPRDTRTN